MAQKKQQSLCAAALHKPKCLQKSLKLYNLSHVMRQAESSAPGCRDFSSLLSQYWLPGGYPRRILLAEPCKCVTVSDVLKHLTADKCKE